MGIRGKFVDTKIEHCTMIAPIIRTKKVPSLKSLNSLALKYIFDKFHITKEEECLLSEGIEAWVRKIDLSPYEKKELQVVIDCLIRDKEGRFDSEKHAYKRADIDYRKVYSEGI